MSSAKSIIAVAIVLLTPTGAGKAQMVPDSVKLTDAQKEAIDKAHKLADAGVQSKVVGLVEMLTSTVKELDRNLLADAPDPDLAHKLSSRLAKAIASLIEPVIDAKLAGDRDAIKVLTAEQKKLVLDALDKPDANPDLGNLINKVLGGQK